MKKIIFILLLILSIDVWALSPRDVFPESEIKRFRSLTDFQLDAGTDAGQMLHWDASNNKWIPTGTPAAADRIVFWDSGENIITFLTHFINYFPSYELLVLAISFASSPYIMVLSFTATLVMSAVGCALENMSKADSTLDASTLCPHTSPTPSWW